MKDTFKVLLLLFFSITIYSETIYLNRSSLSIKEGLIPSRSSYSGINLNFNLNKFDKTAVRVNGEEYSNISIQGVMLPSDPGTPNLPVYSRYIVVPNGSKAQLKINGYDYSDFDNVRVSPSPEIPVDSDDSPVKYPPLKDIYKRNSVYPQEIVTLSDPIVIRGITIVSVNVYPFQYNAQKSTLRAIKNIDIEITFSGGSRNVGNKRLRNEYWDNILRPNVINPELIEKQNYGRNLINSRATGCDYLIISANDEKFIEQGERIKAYRNAQGIYTKLVTVADIGGNDENIITKYIEDAYNNWDIVPSAVLIVGDYGYDNRSVTMPYAEGYCISDNEYADINGDIIPDIVFARMVANSEEQLKNIVDKVINYENNPITDASFYNKPVVAMGWQTERWFQVFGEVTYQFLDKTVNKDPIRQYAIYEGDPSEGIWSTSSNTETILDYFCSDGLGYLPNSSASLTDFSGSASGITSAIEDGSFMVIHRDHGGVTGWGEPDYEVDDVEQLNNDKLPIVLSLNCLTGKFDADYKCFAEAFIQHEKGAVGILAATETSWSWVNDTYGWGMIDYMWQNFLPDYPSTAPASTAVMPAFASVYGKIFLSGSSWPCNPDKKKVTYSLFHYHGDAFTVLPLDVPQNLTLNCPATIKGDVGTITVTTESGAKVAISQKGELLGVKTATGSSLSFDIPELEPGEDLLVTATKNGCKRVEKKVIVEAGSLGYISLAEIIVSDPNGNNNAKADFGESISFQVKLKNSGGGIISGVTSVISCDDNNIEITNKTLSFGNINANTVGTKTGFTIKISDNVEDGYNVKFNMNIKDQNGKTWDEKFRLNLNAPILIIEKIEFTENGNNNGLIEAGESSNLTVHYKNIGNADTRSSALEMKTSNTSSIISGEKNIGVIKAQEYKTSSFVVSVNQNFKKEIGLAVDFKINADVHNAEKSISLPTNKIIEDFETGDFSKLDWYFLGDEQWMISDSVKNTSGKYCAQAGTISHSQSSGMAFDMYFPTASKITFDMSSSCQWWRDYLSFHVDGENAIDSMYGWSGGTYDQYTVVVPEGQHTIQWRFRRDDENGDRDNTVYVDNIEIIFGAGHFSKADVAFSVDTIKTNVNNNEIKEYELTITNNGTEAARIQTKLTMFDDDGDKVTNPTMEWKHKFSFYMPTPNTGLVYHNGEIYTSEWAGPTLTKWDLNGNKKEEVEISGVNSMRTITTDGEYFYAVNRTSGIVKVDMDDKKVVERLITPGLKTDPNSIAYDNSSNAFWTTGYTDASDGPDLVDMDMNVIGGANGFNLTHYDLAFDNFTPGGPYLWIVERRNDDNGDAKDCYIRQYDIENQKWTGVEKKLADDAPGGVFITDELTEGKVSVLAFSQGDTLDAYDLCDVNTVRISENRVCLVKPGETKTLKLYIDGKKLNNKLTKGLLKVSAGTNVRGYKEIPIVINGDPVALSSINNKYGFKFLNIIRTGNLMNVRFSLPSQTNVTLNLFDVKGRLIKALVNEKLKAGIHTSQIDISMLGTGIYFFNLKADSKVLNKKMMLLK